MPVSAPLRLGPMPRGAPPGRRGMWRPGTAASAGSGSGAPRAHPRPRRSPSSQAPGRPLRRRARTPAIGRPGRAPCRSTGNPAVRRGGQGSLDRFQLDQQLPVLDRLARFDDEVAHAAAARRADVMSDAEHLDVAQRISLVDRQARPQSIGVGEEADRRGGDAMGGLGGCRCRGYRIRAWARQTARFPRWWRRPSGRPAPAGSRQG